MYVHKVKLMLKKLAPVAKPGAVFFKGRLGANFAHKAAIVARR
jgi:hypothetical protein